MSGFDCREASLPTVVAALLDSSLVLLQELYRERGHGPWVDELYFRLRGVQRATLLLAGQLPPTEAAALGALCDSLAMG